VELKSNKKRKWEVEKEVSRVKIWAVVFFYFSEYFLVR
jgi:hypothetical protein